MAQTPWNPYEMWLLPFGQEMGRYSSEWPPAKHQRKEAGPSCAPLQLAALSHPCWLRHSWTGAVRLQQRPVQILHFTVACLHLWVYVYAATIELDCLKFRDCLNKIKFFSSQQPPGHWQNPENTCVQAAKPAKTPTTNQGSGDWYSDW